MNEREIKNGFVICSDGVRREALYCTLCRHSRYFITEGRRVPSPALACCSVVRASEKVDAAHASLVGCAEDAGDGFSNVGNIIS